MHYDILLTRLTFDQNLSFWFTVRLSFCQFLLHVRSQNQLFFLTDQHLIKTFHSQYFYLLLMLVKSFFYSTNRLIQSSRVMSRNNTGHFKKNGFLFASKSYQLHSLVEFIRNYSGVMSVQYIIQPWKLCANCQRIFQTKYSINRSWKIRWYMLFTIFNLNKRFF